MLVDENDERTGEISIEEYREWKKNYVPKWINNTWLYKKITAETNS